jgi:gas vesicle protein
MNDKGSNLSRLNFFLIGAGIGAVVALLFAPKSGKALREDISDGTQRGLNYANNGIKQVKDGAEQLINVGRDRTSDLMMISKDFIDTQKEIMATAFDAGKKAYQDKKNNSLKPR